MEETDSYMFSNTAVSSPFLRLTEWTRSGGGSILLGLELVVSSPKEHGLPRWQQHMEGWEGAARHCAGSVVFHGFLSGASVWCQLSNGGISFQHTAVHKSRPQACFLTLPNMQSAS